MEQVKETVDSIEELDRHIPPELADADSPVEYRPVPPNHQPYGESGIHPTLAAIEAELGEIPEFFTVYTRKGHPIKCKGTRDATDMVRAAQMGDVLGKQIAQGAVVEQWKPYLPMDVQVATLCVLLHRMAVDPPFSMIDALRWAKTQGPELMHVGGQVATFLGQGTTENFMADVDAAKKNLEGMAFSESITPFAGNGIGGTPTTAPTPS